MSRGWEKQVKYMDDWPEKVLKLYKQGKSDTQVAVELGISRQTFYTYIKEGHSAYKPVFAEAVGRGRDLAQAWWEQQAQEGLWVEEEGPRLNNSVYHFIMARRFKRDYGDELKVVGDAEKPLSLQVDDVSKLTNAELTERVQSRAKGSND